ncbi:type II secretion system protein GspK [Gemmatimonas sp.]|uniref:type II secretion system protein GspK n=1 Tax=Gemmatimonas sp. TaxID=1962908 RepID=UPI00286ABB44|nr:type II secretion system protein GspK [Gemmatimonas sp.]
MTTARVHRARRGAALVVALVTIAVLASVTAIASSHARRAASVVDNRRSQITARAMAESGVLATRARLESSLRDAGADSARVDGVFDALTADGGAPVQDTVGDGIFATAVIDVSARLDVNTAGADGLQQLLATVAPPSEARRVADAIEAHVRGDAVQTTNANREAMQQRRQRDSVAAALLGREETLRAMQPFTSLDELLTVPGMQAAWLDALAADLTVDGDGRVNRRTASRRVLAAAAGALVDRPSRLLVISRGWRRDHVLTREIQAVFDVHGAELRLVRWREQDR